MGGKYNIYNRYSKDNKKLFLQFSLKFLPLINVLKKICFTLGRICQDIPSQGLKNLKTAILLTKDSVSCPNRSRDPDPSKCSASGQIKIP